MSCRGMAGGLHLLVFRHSLWSCTPVSAGLSDWIHIRASILDLVQPHALPCDGRWISSLGIPPFSYARHSRAYRFVSCSVDWIHVRSPISDSVLIHVLPRNGRRASSVGIPPFLMVLYSRVRGSLGLDSYSSLDFGFGPAACPAV